MKKGLILLTVLFVFCLVCLQAETKQETKQGYATATVVSVKKHEAPSNYIGTATDAPLQADDYSYDIGIRFDCNVYVGRYDSAIDYLPSVFAPNHQVDVRMQKHIMYVSLPYGDREVKMGIVSHKRLKEAGCSTSS